MSHLQRLALLTRHGKAQAVGAVAAELAVPLCVVDDFDTDTLGTFTNERPRQGSQFDAALRKAQLASERAGCRWGLGSEGSFGPDPYVGQAPWGLELLVLYDAELGVHLHAVAQGPQTNYRQISVSTFEQALTFAASIGFPGHGLILGRAGEPWFDKEVREPQALEARCRQALDSGELWLETDMRAHRNPTRMAMIEQAAQALALRLRARCPACEARGYGPVALIPGALCDCCGHATSAARAQRLQCPACAHEAEQPIRDTVAASRCELCNP